MEIGMIVGLIVVAFLVLMAIGTPVAFALAASGAGGILLLRDLDMVVSTLGNVPYTETANYAYAIVPMYILLGMLALQGGLAERAYALADQTFGRLRSGPGIATVGACAGFAAVTGSSVATAATIGRLSVGEMQKAGYPPGLAAGIVAAAGTLGALIPPSVVLVFYGIQAGESIAGLLLAGIIPGIASALIYVVYIMTRGNQLVLAHEARLQDALAAAGGRRGREEGVTSAGGGSEDVATLGPANTSGSVTVKERQSRSVSARTALWFVAIFAVVLGGVFTGAFTVTESGAMGAALALIILVVERRINHQGDVTKSAWAALKETAGITSMAMALFLGATIFTLFLVLARVPTRFASWVTELPLPNILVLAICIGVLILMGMALDSLSIIIIMVPLLYPLVTAMGFDGIWFGIIMVKVIEIGLVTPPVGMNVYIVSGVSGVPLERTFAGVMPFIALDVITIALLVMFPGIATWLPHLVNP